MIIKHAENRERDIVELTGLLALPHLDEATKNKINQEIKNIRSGIKGEQEAAYNINFHYENNKNWAIIHDLRLEHGGYTAQIDHLLINRFMDIYVFESKRFTEGIAVNEHGEFAAFYQQKAYGIPSPIEQNERHIKLLKKMCDAGDVELPMRLGLRMKPKFHSLILITNNARISRPKNAKNMPELGRIIKNEQVFKQINKDIDNENAFSTIASVGKIISSETLRQFAQSLADLHQPIAVDWKARFGIQDMIQPLEKTETSDFRQPETESASDSDHHDKPRRLFCANCKKTVTPKVAEYCWSHKTRFQGKVFCFDCQKQVKGKQAA